MIRSALGKAYIACILIALFFVPLSATAASSINLNFDTTILETMGPSPLNIGDAVQGQLQINAGDYIGTVSDSLDFFGVPFVLDVEIFQGATTWGWANGPGWTQPTPGIAIGLTVINDFVLPPGSVSNMSGYVNSAMFPNLPSDEDVIDAVLISVLSNDLGVSSLDKSFSVGFIYDAADAVVTGPGLGGVDATQLVASAIYGEFFADAMIADTDISVWEATGPLGASPVPIPAAVWLFGSGLLGLIGFARKRRA